MTPRALLVLALPVVALLLTACAGDAPVTPRTRTVTVAAPPATGTPTTTPPSSTTSARPTAAAPTSYDQAISHFQAAQVNDDVKGRFTSPTGNIYCDMGVDGSTNGCELKVGRIAPPTADYCPAGGGAKDIGRIEVTPQGPRAVCNTDTIAKEGPAVLAYGTFSRISGSPLQCVSETIGMTCVDTTLKKGFFLARDTFLIF